MLLLTDEEIIKINRDYDDYVSSYVIEAQRATAKAQLKKVLIGIGKEVKGFSNNTYLVPDYLKYKEALKEIE